VAEPLILWCDTYPFDYSDDNRFSFNQNQDHTTTSIISDTPSDFATCTNFLQYFCEYRQTGLNDDTISLGVYIANGTTMLAGNSSTLGDAQIIDADVTNTTDTTAGTVFNWVNTTADKATWDGALAYLVQDYQPFKGGDGARVEVDFCNFTGSYETTATSDDLLADDLQSSSELSTPAIGQTHALTADDLQSSSELSTPALAQEHTLTADDLQSASDLSTPALGQSHNLTADDLQSASELSTPAIAQTHVFTAGDLHSASQLSTPSIGYEGGLLADDLESASELSAPTIAQTHVLTAGDLQSQAQLSTPAIGQVHALGEALAIESASELSVPELGTVHALTGSNLQAASQLSAPVITQEHQLTADDLESLSELSIPDISAADIIGYSAATSGNDAMDAVGLVLDRVTGTIDYTEQEEWGWGWGEVINIATADILEARDVAYALAERVASGQIDAVLNDDTTTFSGVVSIGLYGSPAESQDIASATGNLSYEGMAAAVSGDDIGWMYGDTSKNMSPVFSDDGATPLTMAPDDGVATLSDIEYTPNVKRF